MKLPIEERFEYFDDALLEIHYHINRYKGNLSEGDARWAEEKIISLLEGLTGNQYEER